MTLQETVLQENIRGLKIRVSSLQNRVLGHTEEKKFRKNVPVNIVVIIYNFSHLLNLILGSYC